MRRPWPVLSCSATEKKIHLLKSSTCFKHYPAHLQEVYVVIVYMQPLVPSLIPNLFTDLTCSSVDEFLFHQLPGLFGQELWYYEFLIAFEMKWNWSRQLNENNSVNETGMTSLISFQHSKKLIISEFLPKKSQGAGETRIQLLSYTLSLKKFRNEWRYQRLHIYNYDVDLLMMSRAMLETCRGV